MSAETICPITGDHCNNGRHCSNLYPNCEKNAKELAEILIQYNSNLHKFDDVPLSEEMIDAINYCDITMQRSVFAVADELGTDGELFLQRVKDLEDEIIDNSKSI